MAGTWARQEDPARQVLYARLQIAFVLAGRGSATRFAAEHRTTLTKLLNCVRGASAGNGRIQKSFRLDQAAEQFIQRMFTERRDILTLPVQAGLPQSRITTSRGADASPKGEKKFTQTTPSNLRNSAIAYTPKVEH